MKKVKRKILHFLVCLAFFSCSASRQMRSYQVQCTMDSMVIYDKAKKIGVVMYDDHSSFSNLILKDNQ